MNSVLILIYLALINITGLLVMAVDKKKAKQSKWRIPEKVLWTITLLGGGIGTFFGMTWFRHKTKKWQFIWGIPAVILLELALFIKVVV
ncbi:MULTISPECIES: DUF1294 domain-containing protein [unclassified Fusibacter]|uniref:DUF1294 domain-containing protein n=1 Tax=unclassified Fusibacter TaxID=2624464 RepID=UPI001011DE98|nr:MULTISPECIES: DUF1294 domain-containing protein [unclassified Fusibacter]MCK8059279.1 DUF1294 domain-containing protein [Fusibacter sp. A2]NPE21257.1 DUF1294 domain-containing protein [Fusibacter sp. A1]RXV62522.1 DUF1294 domain-containing protein [Fusibacter sp. A1]